MDETGADEFPERHQPDEHRGKPFLPVPPVRPDDGRNGILINERMGGEDIPVPGSVFITLRDRSLNRQGNLGIGNDGRKQECMGMTAGIAEDPRHPKQKDRVSLSEFTGIAAVPDQTAGMATGTGDQI